MKKYTIIFDRDKNNFTNQLEEFEKQSIDILDIKFSVTEQTDKGFSECTYHALITYQEHNRKNYKEMLGMGFKDKAMEL